MKVKLATQVLSNSVSAGLQVMSEAGLTQSSASATCAYTKRMNDTFDVLNSSSPLDPTPLRRPLHVNSPSIAFLEETKEWLEVLDILNPKRRCSFLTGLIQSIQVCLELNSKLTDDGFPYLSTRNLCQDGLELFFGKVRQRTKFTDAYSFCNNYAKVATASLLKEPAKGNCEATDEDELDVRANNIDAVHLNATIELMSIPNPTPPRDFVSLEESQITEMLQFKGEVKLFGSMNCDTVSKNASAYFAGYVAAKLNKYHLRTQKKSMHECSAFCNIFTSQSDDLHLFTSFKEFEKKSNSL